MTNSNNFSEKLTRNLSKAVAAAALVASVAAPNILYGQTQQAVNKVVTTTDVNNFCAKISTLSGELAKTVTQKMGDYETRKQDRISKVKGRQTDRNKKITDKRSEWDSERTQHFAGIQAKAKTDEQISAVSEYESTVKAAVNTKRAKVDAAIKTYNDGISALLNSRVDGLDGALDGFKDKVDAAVLDAKNACAAGGDPAEAKSKLKAVIEQNKNSLKDSVKVLPAVKADVEKLQANRKAAISVAEMEFKTAVEKAQTTLKAAFK